MSQNYSKEIAAAVTERLNELGAHYAFDEGNGVFNLNWTLKGKLRNVRLMLVVNEEDLECVVVSAVSADPEDAAIMANLTEFLTRANYGLKCGGFDMDMSDGEIRYRTYVDCRDGLPGPKAIERMLYTPLAMYDRYGVGILAILFQGASAKDAYDKCE